MKHETLIVWLLGVAGAMLGMNIALGAWIGGKVYEKVEIIGNYVQTLNRSDGIQDSDIASIDRRLQRIEAIADSYPRSGPIKMLPSDPLIVTVP